MGAFSLGGISSALSQAWDDITGSNPASDLWYNGIFGEVSPAQYSALQKAAASEVAQVGGSQADQSQAMQDITNALAQSGSLPTAFSPTTALVLVVIVVVGFFFLEGKL